MRRAAVIALAGAVCCVACPAAPPAGPAPTDAGTTPDGGAAGEGEGEGEGEGAGEGEGEGAGEGEGEGEGEGAALFVSTGDAYAPGPLAVASPIDVEAEGDLPAPLVVTSPSDPGRYAVVLFLHGFQLDAHDYSALHDALASHGLVVIAPQSYPPGTFLDLPSTTEEAAQAAATLAWVEAGNLLPRLPAGVLLGEGAAALGIAGHSRGGKVAYRMLDASAGVAAAVAGIDPVDGEGMGTDARVIDGPFAFDASSLVIGTGLGPSCTGAFCQPCAPAGDNHVQFFEASPPPTTHVVVPGYGHSDMMDPACGFFCGQCDGNDDPQPMRDVTAGLLVAFFRDALQGDDAVFASTLAAPPVEIEVESR